jgi:hypothetical protein
VSESPEYRNGDTEAQVTAIFDKYVAKGVLVAHTLGHSAIAYNGHFPLRVPHKSVKILLIT